jgi:hypothetical protein
MKGSTKFQEKMLKVHRGFASLEIETQARAGEVRGLRHANDVNGATKNNIVAIDGSAKK